MGSRALIQRAPSAMAAAALLTAPAISAPLFPGMGLLYESACTTGSSDMEEMEDTRSQEQPFSGPLPQLFTLPLPVPCIIDISMLEDESRSETSIIISDADSCGEDEPMSVSSQVEIEASSQQQPPPPPPAMMARQSSRIAYSAALKDKVLQPTVWPKQEVYNGDLHAVRFAHLAREKWVDEDYLSNLQPPTTMPEGMRVLDAKVYEERTERVGRYLIARKFPIIGYGASTVTFLIEPKKVAKVALRSKWYDEPVFEQHRKERSRDVLHALDHPNAFAASKYLWVKLMIDGNGGWFEELYVQELVRPVGPEPNFYEYLNCADILKMRNTNRRTRFNQWGTRDDGKVIKSEQTLLCFDYQ